MPGPVTLILLGLIAYVWFRPPAWVTELDQPAPDLPELAALRGQVVLVNFWGDRERWSRGPFGDATL